VNSFTENSDKDSIFILYCISTVGAG